MKGEKILIESTLDYVLTIIKPDHCPWSPFSTIVQETGMGTMKHSAMLCLCGLVWLFAWIPPAQAQEKILTLSLNDCLTQALRDNLNLKQYNLGLRYNELSVVQAQSAFDLTFSSDFTRSESETQNFFQYYNVNAIQRKTTNFDISLGQDLPMGTTWGFGLYSTLSSSNIETAKNYTSNLGIQISQPLLRGFGSTVNTSNIYFARINSERAMYTLREQAISLVYEVERAYWNLVYARETIIVQELSIQQADSLLAYNQKKLELGLMTQSDVLEAQSALVSRQQEALGQENMISTYEDQLRRLLNITAEDSWDLTIVPTDQPKIIPVDSAPDRALEVAFQQRPDYQLLQKDTEQYAMNITLARDALKPNLNLSARYSLNGSGETIGKNLTDLGGANANGWTLGLVFNLPVGNRYAKSDYERRQIDVRRSELRIDELESQIRTDIRTAIRDIDQAQEQIDAAVLTVQVNELKLNIEQERLNNQLSSSYYILQFQRDLANSRNLYNRALVDYILAVADYERARGTLLSDRNISIIDRE